jgi:hypothetical protein
VRAAIDIAIFDKYTLTIGRRAARKLSLQIHPKKTKVVLLSSDWMHHSSFLY